MRYLGILGALLTVGCVAPLELPEVMPEAGLPREWAEATFEGSRGVVSIVDLVGGARLRRLVERALEANPDLAQTASRLRESGALLRKVESSRWPTGELTVGQSRGQVEGAGSSPISSASLGLNIHWEVDVWGRLADQILEAEHRHVALEADYQAAQNSLAARTLQTALRKIVQARRLEIERRRVESLEATLEVVRERFRLGLGAVTDWDASKSELATADATLESLAEGVRRIDRDLGVLLGDLSLTPQDLPMELPEVSLPEVSLPAEVLAARPDVESARARLLASGASVSVARKALLPSFTLSANLNQGGPNLKKALRADPLWSLLGSLATPVFHRKALLSEHEASRYRQREAAFAYRGVLLAALVEVENVLSTEHTLHRRLPSLKLAQRHAELALQSFQARYAEGLVDILDLLSAQRTAFDTELRWLEARSDLLQNRIELGLIVGLGAL